MGARRGGAALVDDGARSLRGPEGVAGGPARCRSMLACVLTAARPAGWTAGPHASTPHIAPPFRHVLPRRWRFRCCFFPRRGCGGVGWTCWRRWLAALWIYWRVMRVISNGAIWWALMAETCLRFIR